MKNNTDGGHADRHCGHAQQTSAGNLIWWVRARGTPSHPATFPASNSSGVTFPAVTLLEAHCEGD